MHVDLLRVNLNVAIHAVVPLELTGADEAPGVKEGGVLEQITRELNIEALPTAIPESITHDVSAMQINDTITLADVTVPEGVTLLDDLEETVVATLTPPRLETEERRDRGGDRARRRGRGAGRGRRPSGDAGGDAGERRPPCGCPAAAAAPRAGRLARRRARQPRARATPARRTTSASRSPTRSPRAGSCRARRRSSPAC